METNEQYKHPQSFSEEAHSLMFNRNTAAMSIQASNRRFEQLLEKSQTIVDDLQKYKPDFRAMREARHHIDAQSKIIRALESRIATLEAPFAQRHRSNSNNSTTDLAARVAALEKETSASICELQRDRNSLNATVTSMDGTLTAFGAELHRFAASSSGIDHRLLAVTKTLRTEVDAVEIGLAEQLDRVREEVSGARACCDAWAEGAEGGMRELRRAVQMEMEVRMRVWRRLVDGDLADHRRWVDGELDALREEGRRAVEALRGEFKDLVEEKVTEVVKAKGNKFLRLI